jgi:threonine/homoserine/homoserine lactone efflux protein
VPSLSVLLSFALASLVLILLPGPNMFFVLARGVAGGRRVAIISAFGLELASATFVIGTAIGVSAVLASSAIAFSIVRYAGAAYLFFLAYKAFRGKGELQQSRPVPQSLRRAYGEAYLVGITNPKVALFFVAFFPQFVSPDRGSVPVQTLLLGAVFVAIGLSFDLTLAVASGSVARLMARRPVILRRQKYVSGGAYLALGAYAAVAGGRQH